MLQMQGIGIYEKDLSSLGRETSGSSEKPPPYKSETHTANTKKDIEEKKDLDNL